MHVFGVEVSGASVPGLADGPAPSGAPEVRLRWVPEDELRARWAMEAPAAGAAAIDRRHGDGTLAVRVTRGEHGAFLVQAPGLGDHVVAPDGSEVLGTAPDGPLWRRQRILFAMVLPLAATLRGVELLHAAAVVDGQDAIALGAPSGGGKTTTSLALRAAGARFLTDDVLACTVAEDGTVRAHAGPRFANVDPAAARGDGTVLGTSDKAHVEPPAGPAHARLRALVVLERGAVERPELTTAVPRLPDLAAHAFVPLVDAPDRLARSLDVWQAMARSVALVRARVPATLPPADVAALLQAHLREN